MTPEQFDLLIEGIDSIREILWWIALWLALTLFFKDQSSN